jgi:hypothetical protein
VTTILPPALAERMRIIAGLDSVDKSELILSDFSLEAYGPLDFPVIYDPHLRSEPVTFARIKAVMDEIERLYPRKSIPSYLKMSEKTHDELRKRLCFFDCDELSIEQKIALEFSAVQIRLDGSLAPGIVKTFNADDEEISSGALLQH